VKRGREPVRARPVLSQEETKRLVEAAAPHLRVFLIAALCTGARPSELMALRWRDICFDAPGTITVFRQKVQLGDTLPLHPRLADELKALRDARAKAGDDDIIFLSARGNPQWNYTLPFNTALERAGLAGKGIALYAATRHTFASHWTGTPGDLQALLGHSSILTTQRYIRSLGDRARASLNAVDLVG
jgi:integrase